MAGSSDRRDQGCMGWCWLCPGSQVACLEAVSVVSSPGWGWGCSCCKMKAYWHLRRFESTSFAEGQSPYGDAEMAV